jgi:hypothetical protein
MVRKKIFRNAPIDEAAARREMIKRSARELIRQSYEKDSRPYGGRPKHALRINVYIDAFPKDQKVTKDDLEVALLAIESGSKGKMKVLPFNNISLRVKRAFYPARVTPGAFPPEAIITGKPNVTDNGKDHGMILPGDTTFIPIGRIGSLQGELFALVGDTWDTPRRLSGEDGVIAILQGSVEDMRTKGDITDLQIEQAVRGINERMFAGARRRIRLIHGDNDTVHMTWKMYIRSYRGVKRVGFFLSRIPTGKGKK